MRTHDMFIRAFKNLKRNLSRTKKTILSVSIGVFSITLMFALNIGSSQVLNVLQGNNNDFLKINVVATYLEKDDGLYIKKKSTQSRYLNDNEINYLLSNFKDRTSFGFVKKAFSSDYSHYTFDKYIIPAHTIGINYEALKDINLDFYKGNKIKDINGAIVSRSFIDKIMLKTDYDGGTYNKNQNVDLINKQIEIQLTFVKQSDNRNPIVIKIDMPVRIDGILQDDTQYFGDVGKTFDEKDPNSHFNYDNSVLYIPLERITELENIYGNTNNNSVERTVTLNTIKVENVNYILEDLKNHNFSTVSSFDSYNSLKYVLFTVKLVLGALGVLILITSAIVIVNTMLMATIERKKEIGIIKAIGIKIRDIKIMYILEATIIGLCGGVIGVTASYLGTIIINIIFKYSNTLSGNYTKVAFLSWYLVLSSVMFSILLSALACIPTVWNVVRINIHDALRTSADR